MPQWTTEANVESFLNVAIDGSSIPTTTALATWMDQRAAEIHAWMREAVDDEAPGPSGGVYSTIDVTAAGGYALNALCVRANTLGAAIDVLEAMGAADEPRRAERVAELMADYLAMKPTIQSAVLSYVSAGADPARTHYDEGRVTQDTDWTSKTEQGIAFDSDSEF